MRIIIHFIALLMLDLGLTPSANASTGNCEQSQMRYTFNVKDLVIKPPACSNPNEVAVLSHISLYVFRGTLQFTFGSAYQMYSPKPTSFFRSFYGSDDQTPSCSCQQDQKTILLPSTRTCGVATKDMLTTKCFGPIGCIYGVRAHGKCVRRNVTSSCTRPAFADCAPPPATTTTSSARVNNPNKSDSMAGYTWWIIIGITILISILLCIFLLQVRAIKRKRRFLQSENDDDVQMISLASPDIVLTGSDNDDAIWRTPGSDTILPTPLLEQSLDSSTSSSHTATDLIFNDDPASSTPASKRFDPITGRRLDLQSPPLPSPVRFDSQTGLPV